jgi:uncharacterized protein
MSAHAMPLQPVREHDRAELIDVLRGFALLGILLVNFWGATGTTFPAVDEAVGKVLEYAVSGSFYPLFSFLFGLGFGIQLLRAQQRGTGAMHLYLRRMLVLFLIGTAHAVVIWSGDILVSYAMIGLLLVPMGRLPMRGLAALILILAAVQLSSDRINTFVNDRTGHSENQRELLNMARSEAAAVENQLRRRTDDGETTLANAVAIRWIGYARNMEGSTRWQRYLYSDILLLFLIGMFVGRKRYLEDARQHRRGLLAALVVAAVAVGAGHVYDHFKPGWAEELNMLSWWFMDKGVTLLYVSGIALLFTTAHRATRALRIFAAPGRMALTNYLSQSLVMTLLFVPYGAGLTPLTTTAQLAFSLAFFFLLQVPVSRWWMSRYTYGPVEWLWRSLSYGAAQPMRRRPQAVVVEPQPVVTALQP